MIARDDIEIVDWNKVQNVTSMVADRTMQRGDLKFGPIKVKVYRVAEVLRIDFVEEN